MEIKHKIFLHGKLAAKYGRTFELCVKSAREAAKLLAVNFPEFSKDFCRGAYKVYLGKIKNGLTFDNESLDLSLGEKQREIHFVPVLSGAKSGGLGKVLLGAVIIAGAVIAAPFTGGTSITAGLSGFTFGTGGAFAAGLGLTVALSGIASSLYKVEPMQSFERPDERPSTFMSAPVNMTKQGGCIPAIYGEVYCGSVLINAGLEVVKVVM